MLIRNLFYTLFGLVPLQLFSQLLFSYTPSPLKGNQIVAHSQFTLSYNEEHEQPDWVAYELTSTEVQIDRDRCNCFKSDRSITTGSASLEDYRSSGFDRGHLSPAADNKASDKANRESFLMSNMSPQLPRFNQGIWGDLEEWVREQARQHNKIYVVTGPIFTNNLGTIGENRVTIPGYYYKVILRFDDDGKARTIAFLLPHVNAIGSIEDYMVRVNTIESLTGIDFFPELDDSEENKIENHFSKSRWGFN